MKRHPRIRLHEPGIPYSDCLPSEITFSGEGSDEHRADYARALLLVASHSAERQTFASVVPLVHGNGYALRFGDLTVLSPEPDTDEGAGKRDDLGQRIGVPGDALRVTTERVSEFRRWVQEHVPRNAPSGLVGAEWWIK